MQLTPTEVLILEYKLDEPPCQTLQQLEVRGYHHKYLARGQRVMGVGVQIDRVQRKVVHWETRLYTPDT